MRKLNRIKYICFYDSINSKRQRNYVLSATTKIDYIISKLNENGYSIDIISLAWSTDSNVTFDKGRKTTINSMNTLKLFSSFGACKNRCFRFFDRLYILIQFLFWAICNLHKEETIIVYHSLYYDSLICFLKKIIGFKIVGEIEEIYQDIQTLSKSHIRIENSFFYHCDKFIFSNHRLNRVLNLKRKPSIVINGIYKSEKSRGKKFDDSHIHVVYAGTFDPRKGGVNSAIACAQHLPDNFHIHIIGFGSESEVQSVQQQIKDISQISESTITYDGLLKGEEFIQFIQKCEIGISAQNPKGSYNNSSFPSKILTYMANGLKVVTIDIPVIRESTISKQLFFYKEPDPKHISQTIIKAHEADQVDYRQVLDYLDLSCKEELKHLLSYTV